MKLDYAALYENLFRLYNAIPYRFFGGFSLPPAQYYLGLTYDCNIDCAFCFDGRKDRLQESELSLQEIKNIIDQVPFYGLMTYVGGEPFMRRDIVEIINYSATRCKFTIVTNGTFNIEKNVRLLADKGIKSVFHKGLVEVAVSLSGTEQRHDEIVGMKGAFSKSVEGVKRLVKARKETGKRFPLISIRLPILPDSIATLHELVLLARELDVDFCVLMLQNMQDGVYDPVSIHDYKSKFYTRPKAPAYIPEEVIQRELELIREIQKGGNPQIKFTPSGLTAEEIIKYYSPKSNLKRAVCFQPWQKVMIEPNGDVLPCTMVKEGNLKNDTVWNIWNRTVLKKFRQDLKTNKTYPICFGCCGLTYIPNSGIDNTARSGIDKVEASHSISLRESN